MSGGDNQHGANSAENRVARRAVAGIRNPSEQVQPGVQGAPGGGMGELGRGLGALFGGGQRREEKYVPVTKSLKQIGLDPRIMDVMIGEQPVQCFVIPCQELVYKEWQHMTGGDFTSTAVGEEENDEQ